MRVLLIEADPTVAARLRDGLGREGLAVRVVQAASDAGQIDDDLVLIGLPDDDRLALCRTLRAGDPGRRIVMLTPDGTERQFVAAFEAGADDALGRDGVSVRELAARLRAIGRRRSASVAPAGVITAGRLRLDPELRQVEIDGRAIHVAPTELHLLLALCRAPGRVLAREVLLRRVWGDRQVEPRTLDSVVRRLRAQLGPAGELVETVRGVGFRLRA